MISQSLEADLHYQLEQLSTERQRQVLEFARSLVAHQLRGVPGKDLLRFAGAIHGDDLEIMRQAIEEGCEQVDLSEW